MSLPRLIIPISQQFSVRYLLRTGLLNRISEYAQPVILLAWSDEALCDELERAGVEVHLLPRAEYARDYMHIQKQLDVYHITQVRSPTTAIDARRRALFNPAPIRWQLRDALYHAILAFPGYASWTQVVENKRLRSATNLHVFSDLLADLRADAVFTITPFLRNEHLLLRAARDRGLPLAASILSFDNLTTRGWIPITFDLYMVWNAYNQAEVRRVYPNANECPVKIVGAPQMDFYWNPAYVWPEAEWRASLNLPSERPVILFGGGPTIIVQNEPQILCHLDEAISAGRVREKPVILLRPHPHDKLERWSAALERCHHVICDEPWSAPSSNPLFTNVTCCDIEKLASTLKHSAVHINTSSTMTIDGAIFDRPQIGPAYDETSPSHHQAMKELYEREHFLPILRSGGLSLAHSRDELIRLVNGALESPARWSENRRRMVRSIITFDDGQSTHRLALALQDFINDGSRP